MAGLKIAYVAGVMPGKWIDRWRARLEEHPLEIFQYDVAAAYLALLVEGEADLVFIRWTGESPASSVATDDKPALHVIPLYEEVGVVCAPKDHDIEYFDDVVPAEAVEGQNFFNVDEFGPKMTMELVSTGAGLAVMPMSLARLHRRKDVVSKSLEGAPTTSVGLAWLRVDPVNPDPRAEATESNPLVAEFIGIVRGRTASSSRQPSIQTEQEQQAKVARKERQSAPKPNAAKAKNASAASGSKSGAKNAASRRAKPSRTRRRPR